MPKTINLSGKRFGRLTVLSRVPREQQRGPQAEWLCSCDCGMTTTVFGGNLRSGNTTSCGCYHSEVMRELSPARRVRLGTLTRWTNRHGVTSVVQPDGTIRRHDSTGRELSPRTQSAQAGTA